MKKILFALFIIAMFPTMVSAQATADFKVTSYSFGKIIQHKTATTEFSFINNSNKPLVIEIATAECGCTTPEYPKTPILKGKSGVIKVTYNAADIGQFKKNVTVKFANIADPVVLSIDGEVVK